MSTNASQLVGLVRKFIPPLTNQLHKGQAGRVAVVGGSEDYTGAPFFAAISTLKLGSDLCHVFCEQNAGLVIKSYSAELIVHPYLQRAAENPKLAEPGKPEYNAALDAIVDRVVSVFHRLHVLVVGPGLSRDQALLDSTKRIIAKARQTGMPIVVDADGLFLVQNEPDVIKGYSSAILTPNANEFKRLCESMNISFDPEHKDSMAMRLSQALGHVTIVQKGDVDVISNGSKGNVGMRLQGQSAALRRARRHPLRVHRRFRRLGKGVRREDFREHGGGARSGRDARPICVGGLPGDAGMLQGCFCKARAEHDHYGHDCRDRRRFSEALRARSARASGCIVRVIDDKCDGGAASKMDAPLDLREDEPKAYLQELRFSFGALRSERVQGADPLATLPRYLTPFPDTLDAPVDRPHALEPFHPAPFAEYAPVEASHADLGLIPPPTAWNTLEEPLLLAKPVEKRWNVSTPLEPMPPRSPPSLFRRVDEELAMPKVSKAVFATLMSVLDGFQPSSDSDHDCHLELLLRDTLQAPPTNSAVEFDLPLLPTPADRSIKSFVISKSKRSTSPARYESPSSILYRYLPDAVFAITKDSLPQQAQASVLEPFRSDVSAEFDVQSLEASLLSALAGTEHAVKFRSLDLPVFPNDSDLLKLRGKDWLAEIPLAPFEATPALPDGLRAFLDQAPRSEQALEPFNVSSSCPAFLAPTLPTPPTIEPVPWDAWVEHFLAKMSLSRLFPTRSIAVSLSRQPWASFIRLTSVIDDMPPHQLPQMPSLSVDEFVGTIVSQMPPFEPIDHELDAEEPPPYRAPGPSPKRQRTEAYLPEGPAIADRSVERTAKASSRITLPNIEPPKQPEDQATSFLSSISDFIRLRGKTAPGLVQPAAAQANSKVRHAPANPQAPAEPAEIHTEDRAEPLESHNVQQPPTPLQLPSRAVADTSAVQHDTPQPWTCLASPQVVDNQALLRCLENDHNIVVVAADWTGQPDLVLSDSVAVYVIDGYDLTQRSERDSSALLDAVCGEEHRPFGGPVLNRIASAAHKYANLAVLVDFSGERGGLSSREEATPRDSFVPPTQLGLASLAALGSALCSVGTLFTAMLCSSPGEAATAIRTIIDTVCIGQRMPSASGNTSAAEKWLDQLGLFNPLEVKELLVGNSLGQLCAGALPQSAEENQFALKIEALISLLNAKLV